MDTKDPKQIKNFPEPLRSFVYRFMACSHHDVGIGDLAEDNPMIYPEFLFDDWDSLNAELQDFVNEQIKEETSHALRSPFAVKVNMGNDQYFYNSNWIEYMVKGKIKEIMLTGEPNATVVGNVLAFLNDEEAGKK